jgi:hypothetical protein
VIHFYEKCSSLTNERISGASGPKTERHGQLHEPVAFAGEAPSTERGYPLRVEALLRQAKQKQKQEQEQEQKQEQKQEPDESAE